MKNSKIVKLVTIGFVMISLTACGSDKISNTTNEPSTYESTVIKATAEEAEATTIEPVITVETTPIESATVEDGEVVIDTKNENVEITETDNGEKIATITAEDGTTTQVVVTENESGKTVIDTTKTVTESGTVTKNTEDNKTEVKVDDNGNITIETTTTTIEVEPTKTSTKNSKSSTTKVPTVIVKPTESSSTESPTTVAPTTTTKPSEPSNTETPIPVKEPITTVAPTSHSHNYQKTLTKSATCESDGYYTYKCSCGDSYIETIKATGHNYSSWTTTKNATCTESGTKTRKCTNCSKTETQTIAATGHNWTSKKIHHDEEGHYNIKKSPVYIQITTTGRIYYYHLDNYAEVCYNILKPLGLWKKEYIKGDINNVGIDTGWEEYYEDESGIYYCFYTGNDNKCNYFDTTWKYAGKYAFGTCNPVDLYDREYNSWSELEKDANLYMTDFGIDVSRYKNHQYEIKTWVVDKAAYDETIYICSECGATK